MAEESKGRMAGYWVLTGLIVVSQGASGVMDLMGAAPVADGLAALGYPSYLLMILGPWKIAGALALAIPGFQRVKEWAYAGFFFDFTGAAASHVMNGDGPDLVAPALVLTFVLVGSYKLLPESRKLA